MFVFRNQRSFSIGGVCVGGLGKPCVLVGTVFYSKERILNGKGGFYKSKAESLIKRQEELSDLTGNPCMLDVYGDSVESLRERIDFVSSVSDSPFMIDSSETKVRVETLKYVDEVGLSEKAVYNSINMGLDEKEINTLRESKIDSAIVLAFNPTDKSLKGRVNLLENGAGVLEKGLLEIAEKDCGIRKIMIDTGITPIGEGAGSALRALVVAKVKFRLPVGNAIHNAVSSWGWIKGKDSRTAEYVDCYANSVLRFLGADFVLYGPIENAEMVFGDISMVEGLVSGG